MTTWSIEYGDETGNQNTRTTDDIGEVHATLKYIVADEERTAGYAGQTATWHGYEERDRATGHGRGNWSLHVTNLDTHTVDGYTLEEAIMTEPTMATPLATVAERGKILTDIMMGLAGLHTSKAWLTVQWDGGTDPVVIREWSDGWSVPATKRWELTLAEDTPNILIWESNGPKNLPPMDALVYIHNAIQR